MAVLKRISTIGAFNGAAGWYISPNGFNLYRVANGESLPQIAARFLNDSSRGDEIWALQSGGWRAQRNDDPNNLAGGDELIMPQEAIDNARSMGLIDGGRGQAPVAVFTNKTLSGGQDVLVTPDKPRPFTPTPPPAPAPIVKPTPSTPSVPSSPSSPTMGKGKMIAMALGATVVLGGGIALVVHHKHKRNPVRRFLLVPLKRQVRKADARDRAHRRNPATFADVDDGS